MTEVSGEVVTYFLLTALPLMGLMIWSANRIRTAAEFYAAGREYGGLRNGLAITGDYLSAASLLGITGLILFSGYSGLLYAVGFFSGWPIILILLADKLRTIGHFTLADVLKSRFSDSRIVLVATLGYFPVVVIYLSAQLVAMTWLLNYIFDVKYEVVLACLVAVALVTALTGRMIFSSRAQMIKAGLVMILMLVLTMLAFDRVSSSLSELFSIDTWFGSNQRLDGTVSEDSPLALFSLGIALILGPVGLPHVMSRFFSVADERRARMSVFYATGMIGIFYILIILLGFLTVHLLGQSGASLTEAGSNLVLVRLAELIGGEFLAAVLVAILVVVLFSVMTSLILTGSSAFSHDWYARTVISGNKRWNERHLHRLASSVTVVFAASLALLWQTENVAYLVGLAFAFSASVNVPLLLGALYCDRLTSAGALAGGLAGLSAILIAVITGPLIWGNLSASGESLFSWRHPALFSLSVAVSVMWFVSRWYHPSRREGDSDK
jgi:cation/acetate symporter